MTLLVACCGFAELENLTNHGLILRRNGWCGRLRLRKEPVDKPTTHYADFAFSTMVSYMILVDSFSGAFDG